MAPDRTEAIRALLIRAERAHAAYEQGELGGVYDEDWPSWYAAYVVREGIGTLLQRDITADDLESLLVDANIDFTRLVSSSESWADYTARRLSSEGGSSAL